MASLPSQHSLLLPTTTTHLAHSRFMLRNSCLRQNHRAQGKCLRVAATAAEPAGTVPPATPEADITAVPPNPTCAFPNSTLSISESYSQVLQLKKGQIVRVDREKYLNSVEYLSVGHPTYFKGLDYIYEDRGEVLSIKFFDHGEYALLAWAGIPTSPAWLPTYMLIKSERLSYRRQ